MKSWSDRPSLLHSNSNSLLGTEQSFTQRQINVQERKPKIISGAWPHVPTMPTSHTFKITWHLASCVFTNLVFAG